MPFSPLHSAAREYAQRGIPVFPCGPDDPSIADPAERNKVAKRPATEHGFHDATTDLAQIDAWWSNADYNIAFQPAAMGLATVDLDGVLGLDNWSALEDTYGAAPMTWTVDTPRGGRHLHFAGSTRPSVGTETRGLAPKIDTRGGGSYALLPPSRVLGNEYHSVIDVEPTPLPVWVNQLLDAQRKEAAKAVDVEPDRPQNIARAADFLRGLVRRGRVALEGQMGDETTFVTACDVLNLGLSPTRTLALMEEIWNPHCEPPWTHEDLAVKVKNAVAYAQNEAGAFAASSPADAFGPVLDKLGLSGPAGEQTFKCSRFYPMTFEELAALPPPSWLVPT